MQLTFYFYPGVQISACSTTRQLLTFFLDITALSLSSHLAFTAPIILTIFFNAKLLCGYLMGQRLLLTGFRLSTLHFNCKRL